MFHFNPASALQLIVALAAVVIPIAGSPVKHEERATVPSRDPFYTPPQGFENAAPGDVLRTRPIIASFFHLIPDPIDARQLLYRTQSIDGKPLVGVTTVFKPFGAKTDRYITFNTAYDSASNDCSPSYTYQWGSLPTSEITAAEFLLVQAYLASGYIVSSADYEGPDAAFAAGRLEARGVLDSMRAVKNYASKLGLTKNPSTVVTGYSGGGIATGWAAALHSSYAPELNVKGWVMGGVPANLTAILTYIDDTLFSGFLPVAVAGLAKPSAFGKTIQPLIDRIIQPKGVEALKNANTKCAQDNLLLFPNKSLFDKSFQSLGKALLQDPTFNEVIDQCILGVVPSEKPSAPVLQYHATDDEIVPYGPAELLHERWCQQGVSSRFIEYKAGGHITTEPLGIIDAVKFAEQAFAGKVPSGCSKSTVLDNKLDPLALGAGLEPILIQIVQALTNLGTSPAAEYSALTS